jgi:hypothetical protein
MSRKGRGSNIGVLEDYKGLVSPIGGVALTSVGSESGGCTILSTQVFQKLVEP